VRKPLRFEPARDDGETLGDLQRPVGGFTVACGYQIHPTIGQVSAEERWPATPDEPWLVPQGRSELAPWPRSDRRWVRSFADLHRGSDADVAAFASRYGWLRFGSLIAPAVLDAAFVPVWGDRIRTWRQESLGLAELLGVLDCSRSVGVGQAARQQVLQHFTGEGGASLWLRAGDAVTRRRGDWGVEWGVSGDGSPLALAFVWRGREEILFVPMPVKGAPEPGANLAVADSAALGVLARHAVGVAIQQALAEHTAAALTLAEGIRVAPRTLLGALYLSLSRELFNRRADRTCPVCHSQFTPMRRDQVYCNVGPWGGNSQSCKSKANYPRRAAKESA